MSITNQFGSNFLNPVTGATQIPPLLNNGGFNTGSIQNTMTTPPPTPTLNSNPPPPPAPSPQTQPQGQPQGQPQSQPQGQGQPDASQSNAGALAQAMAAIQNQVQSNNTLVTQKNLILKQLYDTPLTDADKAQLDPALASVLSSGDRNLIDFNLKLLNDQIAGRTNTLNQSIQTLTSGYSDQVKQAEQNKQDAITNVLNFAQTYGSNAKSALTSLYGPAYVAELKNQGIDLDSFSSLPTLAEQKQNTAGSDSGVTSSIVDPTTDNAVKQIIAQNPGEWGHAADAIDAKFGEGTSSLYDDELKAVYQDGKNVNTVFGASNIPRIVAPYVSTTASGLQYLDASTLQGTASQKTKIINAAQNAGLKIITNKNTAADLVNIGDAQAKLNTIGSIFSNLAQPTALSRDLAGIGLTWLAAKTESNPQVAAAGALSSVGLDILKAISGIQGFRGNQGAIQQVTDHLPTIYDTKAVAKQKIDYINQLISDRENSILGTPQATPQTKTPAGAGGNLQSQVTSKGYDYAKMKADGYSDDDIKKALGL